MTFAEMDPMRLALSIVIGSLASTSLFGQLTAQDNLTDELQLLTDEEQDELPFITITFDAEGNAKIDDVAFSDSQLKVLISQMRHFTPDLSIRLAGPRRAMLKYSTPLIKLAKEADVAEFKFLLSGPPEDPDKPANGEQGVAPNP